MLVSCDDPDTPVKKVARRRPRQSMPARMCGIVGIVSSRHRSPQSRRELLERLLATLAERGPNGSGIFCRHNVGVGHHRLAIRDPDRGKQPWLSADGRIVLVYNGELYNDVELRGQLADEHAFRTQCDTEVVMAAYMRWGRACIDRFEGMFAFGIYDFHDRTLWLVRDRFGVKPLFYATIGDDFVFASRVATLLEHPRYEARPDWQAVSHYLTTTRTTLGSRTLYSGIHQLGAAQQLVLKSGRLQVSRYWDYPQERESTTYADAVDGLHDELTRAIRIRLRSDVPVGLFLSGGVDSSTIASITKSLGGQQRLATCAVAEEAHDSMIRDLHFAEQCASCVQAELHPVQVGAQRYLESWHQLTRAFRMPLSTPSDVMIYAMSMVATRHLGVVLGGEGADELLCGYEIAHWSGHDYESSRSGTTANKRRSLMRQYGRTDFKNEADHYFALNSLIPSAAKRSILTEDILRDIDDDELMFQTYQDVFDRRSHLPMVQRTAMVLHQFNLESLLSRLDSSTMHAGLEARVPFTDHRLVEWVFRQPINYLIDCVAGPSTQYASAELSSLGLIRSKRVLRSVAERLLPPGLAHRPKASFPTPVATWIQDEWRDWLVHFFGTNTFASEFLSNSFHRELKSQPHAAGMWLWPIVNIAMWGEAEFVSPKQISMEARV